MSGLVDGMKARLRAMENKPKRAAPTQKAPEAKRYRPGPTVVDARPSHVCGKRMNRCDDCGEWVCSAPGDARHVCLAFSQVTP